MLLINKAKKEVFYIMLLMNEPRKGCIFDSITAS